MDEFRTILRALFEPHYLPWRVDNASYPAYPNLRKPELTKDEWIHTLKLTTMWGYVALRKAAIYKLRPLLEDSDPVGWLCLARQYEVREWLLPALQALARRPQAIQLEEVELLGIATAIRLAEIRESYVPPPYQSYSVSSRKTYSFTFIINKLFSDELSDAGTGGC
ncbi:hypothetical protein FKP32DRAFT_1589021 [Trametes sanguinea]|nr:hypothetical protein FKP32DRAFT_1589021 [Trametes sanguinea]